MQEISTTVAPMVLSHAINFRAVANVKAFAGEIYRGNRLRASGRKRALNGLWRAFFAVFFLKKKKNRNTDETFPYSLKYSFFLRSIYQNLERIVVQIDSYDGTRIDGIINYIILIYEYFQLRIRTEG